MENSHQPFPKKNMGIQPNPPENRVSPNKFTAYSGLINHQQPLIRGMNHPWLGWVTFPGSYQHTACPRHLGCIWRQRWRWRWHHHIRLDSGTEVGTDPTHVSWTQWINPRDFPWGYPKIIQAIDHDLVLKQPWWLGDAPTFRNHQVGYGVSKPIVPKMDFSTGMLGLTKWMEEILHQLIGGLSHHWKGFNHPRWCRISSITVFASAFQMAAPVIGSPAAATVAVAAAAAVATEPIQSSEEVRGKGKAHGTSSYSHSRNIISIHYVYIMYIWLNAVSISSLFFIYSHYMYLCVCLLSMAILVEEWGMTHNSHHSWSFLESSASS